MQYKDYLIEPFESSPGRWRARIRRLDGRMIEIPVTGNKQPSITTDGMERFSADDAVEFAKEAIDGGGMN